MKRMNFAIVGCGRIAPRHAQSITEIKSANLVVVCDIDRAKADEFAQLYFTEAVYSLNEVVQREDVDVVNICTPSGLHCEMAEFVLRHGKHVLVEKPLSINSLDIARLRRRLARTNLKLGVVLQNRFNPPMQRLRKAIDNNELGKLYFARAIVDWFRPQEYYEDTWHGTRKMGGGVLMNQAIHHLDAMQWFMGMPRRVSCVKSRMAHKMKMEDVAAVNFEFSNGSLGVLQANTFSWPSNLEGSITIFGERGVIKVGGTALNRIEVWRVEGYGDKESKRIVSKRPDPTSVYGQSHKEVIGEMIAAIRENRKPVTSVDEGVKSVRIVEACYKAAKTGGKVLV